MTDKRSETKKMNGDSDTVMEFPCEFPLKVFGYDKEQLQTVVVGIINAHVADVTISEIRSRPSKTGKYIALTIIFSVQSKHQLDLIYNDLSSHDTVLMSL
ncbi:MAG: DUF493 domain-containing protein [Gammaproteobacteria bacterium]|nr:DUF493 domain-containing protein [Gammaproteobacteria bacterium]